MLVKLNKYGGVIAEPPKGMHRDVWVQKLCVSYVKLLEEVGALQDRIAELDNERNILIAKAIEDIQKAKNDGGRCHACAYVQTDSETRELYCRKWPTKECFKWRGLETGERPIDVQERTNEQD